MSDQHEWWQKGIIYQIYPRSFQDSDGDGVGDLAGIRNRLDYLEWLGVDAIWLSPVFPSPMADFGYDVSDYTGIDPLFGSMEDFDQLLEDAHRRGIRIVLDFVPNHSSDQHPWFIESRSSRDNPKRDWYLWRDPGPDGRPPTNWLSSFGGSAWTWDEKTQQYYHHHFLPAQPDLNWRNPQVVDAMLDAMRFWLDRGVDGFRLDVIWLIIKDEHYRDNPENPDFQEHEPPHHQLLATYTTDRPEVHDIISKMRKLLDRYDERMMVGEIYLPIERLVTYYGAHGTGVHLPFNFQLITLPWDARTIARAIEQYEAALPSHGWPNWVLGNHDQPRLASRVGMAQARVAAVMLLTLRGTPTMYYGDEIGMQNVPIPADRVHDPVEKNLPGIGMGRDPQRTPMQWNAAPQAGFSDHEPWLPIAADAAERNVTVARETPGSLLRLYRRLIELRQEQPALSIGSYSPLPTEGDVLAYVRREADHRFIIVLNLGSEPARVEPPLEICGSIALSTHLDREGEKVQGWIELRADEGVIIDCPE
ncbi:alpha-amylase family glycosyl hydrolase [Candidatus Laterigemmans baculatus]|uniref:alpha-amylase family glycosyl hydrolase n=1 Tax=Candidatus Laterigemmans baculatus TaxID=2770505 RepID=UPI0013DBAB45|nr:alpha-amylase family glycosyl hydrolase [Candidatus Laterigemmans baculatus]